MVLNTYVAAIFGGLLKIYDDIVDIPEYAIYSSPRILEIVKVLIISALTYISIHNVNIPFLLFTFHLIHVIFIDKNSLGTDFYFSGMILSFILIFISLESSDLAFSVIPILLVSLCTVLFDHYFFPEEHSWKKIIERCLIGGGLILSPQIIPIVLQHYQASVQ